MRLDLLDEVALVVCETPKKITLPQEMGEVKVWKERIYGKIKLTIYQKGVE